MNFWTFLDRNIAVIVYATILFVFIGALIAHESSGCAVKVGSTDIYVGRPVDGGAP